MAGMNWPTARSSSSPIPTVSAGPGTSAAAVDDEDAQNIDDVGFDHAVVDDIAGYVAIDPKRRYATGISNGGMLAYALACNDRHCSPPSVPTAATNSTTCAAPHPTSVMHIHGTAERIRYEGDTGSLCDAATVDGRHVPDVNAFWRNVDRCASTGDHHERRVDHVDRQVSRRP